MKNIFRPKLLTVLREGYTRRQFGKDLVSGIIVGIVALPLSIAFAIASGVPPEKGLITGIIAGLLISFLGGSRVQIGGPTGAFIVIVYGIVQQYGVDGLIIATFIAGFMILIMGLARLGSVIRYIPHPLIVGFTSGIALIIFSSQVKDFLGLEMGSVPADFIPKWGAFFQHMDHINPVATIISVGTVLITLQWHRITTKVPGSLIAILLSTLAVYFFHLPVDTIGTRFGSIPSTLPMPHIPSVDLETLKHLIQPAFTIALLGAIESLLSAVVSDGMIGGRHNSNTELIAQGLANIGSAVFGGIPATGAIARTATNVKNGGRTPVAGIVHSLTLLLIMLVLAPLAVHIPLATLAGILVVVAYNMSEWRPFLSITRGPASDIAVLLVTFFLTVLIDLTIAIEIGMVLASFLFMRRMAKISKVEFLPNVVYARDQYGDLREEPIQVPKGVEVYEINGPLFFGAAQNFKQAIQDIHRKSDFLIIRMRFVPIIDATGMHSLKELIKDFKSNKTQVVLSGVQPEVYDALKEASVVDTLGEANVCQNIRDALSRVEEIREGSTRF
ncbi:MAG: sulfate permease [Saprospirales bacterium]|nr:sulfate permease [Saprospirales bacterium]